ncbi:TPA: hypothetical protein DIU22_02165 [Candidatus Woesebacteria bacterium]|nr:hypothetical protein [Candidatus Woesebacteria bacterium]
MNFEIMKTLNKKIYSAREALQFIPQIACEPSMRKYIEKDIKNGNTLGAIVQHIGKQKRFFIPKENLEKLIATINNANSKIQTNTRSKI